jgi:hypothetical protein
MESSPQDEEENMHLTRQEVGREDRRESGNRDTEDELLETSPSRQDRRNLEWTPGTRYLRRK